MNRQSTQFFNMKDANILFDFGKCALLCKSRDNPDEKYWIKKLSGVVFVSAVIEDESRYYAACEYDEHNGIFLALSKHDGKTAWYIPGRSLMHVLYQGFLYLIFVDESRRYFLIKAETAEGGKIWHHEVDQDLAEYHFSRMGLRLTYASGREETLSIKSGAVQHGS